MTPSIASCTVTLAPETYTYDGTEKKPSVTVKDGTTTLTEGTDYTVAYSNNTNVGTATVTITGTGSYGGSQEKTFTIGQADISTCEITVDPTSYTYDGESKTPAVTVKNGTITLTRGTDYTVSYESNTDVGTGKVTVSGSGNYTGSVTKEFSISAAGIANCTVTLGEDSYTYDGAEKTPAVTVTNGTQTLTSGTDYELSYSNNVNAGTATVTITGKGNYTGTLTKNFTINKKTLTASISGTTSKVYDGTTEAPTGLAIVLSGKVNEADDVTATASKYEYNSANVDEANTITATGITLSGNDSENYTLDSTSVTVAATITRADASVTLKDSYDPSKTYDASAVTAPAESDLTLTFADYSALDYKWYEGDKATGTALASAPSDAGTYTLEVIAADTVNYKGASATKTFTISKASYTPGTYEKVVVCKQETNDVTVDISGAIQSGGTTGAIVVSGDNDDLISGTPTVADGTLTFNTTSQSDGTSATITVPVTGCTNYNDYEITVTVTAKAVDLSVSGTISGYTGIAIEDTVITLTINSGLAQFSSDLSNADWITNLPKGLSQSITRVSSTMVTITVTGTATEATTEALAVTVPAGSLTTVTGALSLTGQNMSMIQSTYTLEQEGTAGTFADLTYGYETGSSVIYTFKNTGNQSVTGISVGATGDFTAETVVTASTVIEPDETFTVTVTAKTGLHAGQHTGACTLDWTNAADTLSVSLSQTVEKAGLTIKASDASAVYGAQSPDYQVTYTGFVNDDTENSLGGTLAFDCSYSAGSDVGNYDITPKGLTSSDYDITYETGTLSVTKRTAQLSWNNITGRVYGDGLGVTATVSNLYGTDDVSVTVEGGGGSSYGSYTATATGLTGSKAGNYQLPENVTASYSIGKKTLTATITGTTTKTYDGTADAPAGLAIALDGIVGSDNVTATADYAYDSANASDAASITATGITLSGDAAVNYQVAETATVAGTISPMDLKSAIEASTVAVSYSTDYIYTGSGQTTDAAVSRSGGSVTLAEGTDYTVSYKNASQSTVSSMTDAGTYTVTITGIGNYSNEYSYTLTVQKAENNLTAQDGSKTYDGQAASIEATADFGAVTYTWYDGDTQLDDAPTAPGTYSVMVSVEETANYKGASTTVAYEIGKAVPEVLLADKQVTYSGEGISIGTATVNLVNSETYSGDITYRYYMDENCTQEISGSLPVEVGTYYVIASTAAFGNYAEGNSSPAKLVILNMTFPGTSITAEGYSGIYDGSAHTISVSLSGNAEDAVVTYSTAENGTYTKNNPSYTNAGTYTVYYKVSKDRYDDVTGSLTVEITKASQDISYETAEISKTVGDEAFANALTQMVADGVITYTSSAPAVATVDSNGNVTILQAGETEITATVAGTSNYNEASASYRITVEDAEGLAYTTKLVTSDITDSELSSDLKAAGYDTVDKVVEELTDVLLSDTKYSAENSATYDVSLMISTDGGVTWIKATEENFPKAGITLIIPYPDGTNKDDYDFRLVHMFTVTSERLGTVAGDTETPAIKKTADGLEVTLNGLSPLTLGWTKISTSKTSTTPEATTVSTTATATVSAKTGDNNPILPLAGTCAVALAFIAVLAVVRRKKQM
ncbi:MAG: YDG domain-containing protein [Clostridiales bacterium]|nr:YDG domain-containing protein [Clostridiales bacterium]